MTQFFWQQKRATEGTRRKLTSSFDQDQLHTDGKSILVNQGVKVFLSLSLAILSQLGITHHHHHHHLQLNPTKDTRQPL